MKLANKLSLYFGLGVLCMAANSCSMEEPFKAGGEGTLRLNTEIRGDVTKTRAAVEGETLTELRNNCVVYIENSRGIVRRYKGLDNINDAIKLQVGDYVAEAWSGDSVSASFDKKFYRAYEKFTINEGENSMTLHCNIANVLVSVDPASLDVNLKDMKVTFSHSRGELVFDETMIREETKGYFMMPNADKDLSYKVEGTTQDGGSYSKTGKIENVQRAHEYSMLISEDAPTITEGGALIRLEIMDIPVIEESVEIFMGPAVAGVGYDIERQVVSVEKDFSDTKVYIRGYYGLSSVTMTLSDNFNGILTSGVNLTDGSVQTDLRAKGVNVELSESKDATYDGGDVKVGDMYITFSKAFLDALPDSESEYAITFDATDGRHKEGKGSLRFANNEAAVQHIDPVEMGSFPDPEKDPMGILATSAVLTVNIMDAESAQNPGVAYREQGTSQWLTAYASNVARLKATRATVEGTCQVTLTGLKPGTTYECKAICAGFDGAGIKTFSTESIFILPNASMEEWSTYSAQTLLGKKTIVLPGSTGDKTTSFWGSGNEGSATANMTLTDKSTDMVHSGTYSVCLQSKSALGVLAAGNMFMGMYDRTDGTNGVLQLGREYNGTHPTKLRVWANYRPGSISTVKSDNAAYLPDGFVTGASDHGQIYVALTTEPVEIRTNPSNRKLFDAENDETVIAYGQVTWTEAFGPNGQLQMVEIPFEYNSRAKTKKPVYIIMVASASKFGDYFSGSDSSVMYLDDFELVYE